MTKPITFNMTYYPAIRSYLDKHEKLHANPSVGEDSRVYISSWKNKNNVPTGFKLSILGDTGEVKPLNGQPLPKEIRSDLEKLSKGDGLK